MKLKEITYMYGGFTHAWIWGMTGDEFFVAWFVVYAHFGCDMSQLMRCCTAYSKQGFSKDQKQRLTTICYPTRTRCASKSQRDRSGVVSVWFSVMPLVPPKGNTLSAEGLDLTMKGTLNVMFDYCSIPIGTYFKFGAQAGFLSNFEKSPYLCFWRQRLG